MRGASIFSAMVAARGTLCAMTALSGSFPAAKPWFVAMDLAKVWEFSKRAEIPKLF